MSLATIALGLALLGITAGTIARAAADNRGVHASPEVVGHIAQEAGVGRLIVSHFGPFPLDPAIAELKKFCTGPLIIGADMQCTPVQQ